MIVLERLNKTIEEYLPEAKQEVIDRIAHEVARETELYAYELIRLLVSKEKETAYLNQKEIYKKDNERP